MIVFPMLNLTLQYKVLVVANLRGQKYKILTKNTGARFSTY